MHLKNAQIGKNNLVGFLTSLSFVEDKQNKSKVMDKVMKHWREPIANKDANGSLASK